MQDLFLITFWADLFNHSVYIFLLGCLSNEQIVKRIVLLHSTGAGSVPVKLRMISYHCSNCVFAGSFLVLCLSTSLLDASWETCHWIQNGCQSNWLTNHPVGEGTIWLLVCQATMFTQVHRKSGFPTQKSSFWLQMKLSVETNHPHIQSKKQPFPHTIYIYIYI